MPRLHAAQQGAHLTVWWLSCILASLPIPQFIYGWHMKPGPLCVTAWDIKCQTSMCLQLFRGLICITSQSGVVASPITWVLCDRKGSGCRNNASWNGMCALHFKAQVVAHGTNYTELLAQKASLDRELVSLLHEHERLSRGLPWQMQHVRTSCMFPALHCSCMRTDHTTRVLDEALSGQLEGHIRSIERMSLQVNLDWWTGRVFILERKVSWDICVRSRNIQLVECSCDWCAGGGWLHGFHCQMHGCWPSARAACNNWSRHGALEGLVPEADAGAQWMPATLT